MVFCIHQICTGGNPFPGFFKTFFYAFESRTGRTVKCVFRDDLRIDKTLYMPDYGLVPGNTA